MNNIGYSNPTKQLSKLIGQQMNIEGNNSVVRSGLNELELLARDSVRYRTVFYESTYSGYQLRQHLIRPKAI